MRIPNQSRFGGARPDLSTTDNFKPERMSPLRRWPPRSRAAIQQPTPSSSRQFHPNEIPVRMVLEDLLSFYIAISLGNAPNGH